MKKVILIIVGLLVVLFGALLTIPYFFKDDIKAAIDKELASSINADIKFDIDDFSVSLFSNFPNLTVGIKNLSVTGREPFAGKVLFASQNLEVEVNLKKILFDDQMSIQGILLDHPVIWVKVLGDGRANYDIAIETEETTEEAKGDETDETTPFSMSIERWQITSGQLTYDDATIPFVMTLQDLNHTGSGDFSLSLFDMKMNTEATLATLSYDGAEYMHNKHIKADMLMAMDMDAFKFTFKDNEFKVNEFALGMDGWFSMPDEGFDMDLSITSANNSFKSVLSLIPALYATDFEELTASGTVDFNTTLTGMYTDTRMPAFQVNLGIKDGRFQYPDLPAAVENVQFKMAIANKDGNIDHTGIDISKFHIELGNNPIDATLKIDNLVNYPLALRASAKINFAEMMQLFPMEGMELKGLLQANLQAQGVYDTLTSTIPASGQFSLANFFYADTEYLPQGMEISVAKAAFTPEYITLDAFASKVGKSDFEATGKLSNYLNYALKPNEVLHGNLSLASNYMLVDEFMTDTPTEDATLDTTAATPADSATTTAEEAAIPANIDFTMNARLASIEYDGLQLTDAQGTIKVKEGILTLDNLRTNTLGGTITFDGIYDTRTPAAPVFDMAMDMKKIGISESFKAFNTVQKLAPIAQHMEGNLTTKFTLQGRLDNELMPVTSSLNGGGLLKVASARLKGGKFVTALTQFTSKQGKDELSLKDIKTEVAIKDGAVHVAPFDVLIDGHKSTISGSTALDGSLDYKIATSIPAGQLGKQANQLLANLTGSNSPASENINLNLGVTGPYDNPKVALLGSENTAALKKQVTEAAVSKGIDLVKEQTGVELPATKEDALKKAQVEANKLLADAQQQADQIKAEAKKAATQIRAEAQKQSDALLKEAGNNPLKKQGAILAGNKLIKEADKKASQVEAEGNKKADALMATAQQQADALLKKAGN